MRKQRGEKKTREAASTGAETETEAENRGWETVPSAIDFWATDGEEYRQGWQCGNKKRGKRRRAKKQGGKKGKKKGRGGRKGQQQGRKEGGRKAAVNIPAYLKKSGRKRAEVKAATSIQVATWNMKGYPTHKIDNEAEGSDDEMERTQEFGKHEALQLLLEEEEQQGRPVMAMAITETHLRKGEEMMPVDGYVVFYRSRGGGHKAGGGGRGRFHGGVAWLVREEIAHCCTVALAAATYGKSEGVLWLKYDDGEGAVGHMGALYRDSDYMRDKFGMAEEAYIEGLERDVNVLGDEGWVMLVGDLNLWIGQAQEGHGQRVPYSTKRPPKYKELRPTDRLGKDLVAMMKRTGLVSVQGRRGKAERTWEAPTNDGVNSEIDYIIVSNELLPELQAHTVQAHCSELSDHLILKARFKNENGRNFMAVQLAEPRVEKMKWRLNKAMLADEEVQQRVIAAAEEVFGEGQDEDWTAEQWYAAYEEVHTKAAPLMRCGGSTRRATWAWFKALGRGGESVKDREKEIRQVWAAAKHEECEEAQRQMERRLQEMRKQKKVEVKAATKASFAGLMNYIATHKDRGGRDRLIDQLAGNGKRIKEVRAARDEKGQVHTGAKEVADIMARHLERIGAPRARVEIGLNTELIYDEVKGLTKMTDAQWREWLDSKGLGEKKGLEAMNKPYKINEVRNVLRQANWWKAVSTDEVENALMNVMSRSAAFLRRTTAVLTNVWERKADMPVQFLEVMARMAFKRGDPMNPTNYRALSIRSRLAAIFEKVGHDRIRSFIESNNGLEDTQNGGRKGRGATPNLVMLSVAWDTVLDLVVICADVAKCFPRADRKVMLKELAGQGVWGNAWHLLRRMDEGLQGKVMVSGELSEAYAVLQGFLEGDISCPLKCNVLMRAILTDLRTYVDPVTGEDRPLGVVLHGKWVGGSLFLDDSILLARGMVEAQLMCDVVVKRIEDYMISFSGPKTMAVRVNTPAAAAAQPNATLRVPGMVGGAVEELDSDSIDRTAEAKGGWRGVRVGTAAARRRQTQKVAVVEAAARVIQKTVMKYLGVWYKSGGAVNSKHGEYVVSKARRVVGRLAQVGCFEGGLSPAVALDHAESKFGSTVTYGCIAWAYVGIMGNGIGITAAREVERAQLSLAREQYSTRRRRCRQQSYSARQGGRQSPFNGQRVSCRSGRRLRVHRQTGQTGWSWKEM
jgi:endonuclease/exonuclease/phosphatase family metal-dependent hydrolase